LSDRESSLYEETTTRPNENTVSVDVGGGGVQFDDVHEGDSDQSEGSSDDVEWRVETDLGERNPSPNTSEHQGEYNR